MKIQSIQSLVVYTNQPNWARCYLQNQQSGCPGDAWNSYPTEQFCLAYAIQWCTNRMIGVDAKNTVSTCTTTDGERFTGFAHTGVYGQLNNFARAICSITFSVRFNFESNPGCRVCTSRTTAQHQIFELCRTFWFSLRDF